MNIFIKGKDKEAQFIFYDLILISTADQIFLKKN